jgi:endoglucanase
MHRYGFNLQWFFQRDRGPLDPELRVLDAIAAWGFDFVRLPMDYRIWAVDGDPGAADEGVLARIDSAVQACRERGQHVCLALHRAPGYCITGWETEPFDLWSDRPAQDAFVAIWERFARRYADVPSAELSFDLVNEPPALGLRGFDRDVHQAVVRRTAAAIRAVTPERTLVLDGLDGGNLAMPELADLGTVQSVRGYQPMRVSHFGAPWWPPAARLAPPAYPCEYDGRWWDREALLDFYRPWRDLEASGVPVHVGEFGCYVDTPDDVAQAWFTDLLSVFAQLGWGYALWEFEGDFGVVGHSRPGAVFEAKDGFVVDRRLLDLLQSSRT